MTSMTIPLPQPTSLRMYGFNVYRGGVLIREQIVPAATSAIAEVKIWRHLDTDEYVWYAEPRLIEEEAVVIDLPVDTGEESVDDEGEEAA